MSALRRASENSSQGRGKMTEQKPKCPCPECTNSNGCQIRPDMEKYFEKLKHCSFFKK
jgi:hypothetical protein